VAAMPENERSNLIASIIGKIVKMKRGQDKNYTDMSNIGQYYETRDVRRIILTRKANGIFITRQP